MVLFIILGVIVLLTIAVLSILFYMLNKEQKKEEESAVPVTDILKLKMEMSNKLFTDNNRKVLNQNNEEIPVFEAKVGMPTQPAKPSVEDELYRQRARALEDELRNISQKAEGQSDEAKEMIEVLTKDNESLRIQQANLDIAKQKLVEIQNEAASLKAENSNLQSQLESVNTKVYLLEEQMTSVKLQMGEEISRANATVSELTREKEALLAAQAVAPDQGLRQELETLKSEQIALNQKYVDLERTYEKLRELNTHMMEKNDLLQYELIKARAQSSGLERVSFNYKNQLEDFFKKINTVQMTNEQLSQVKNRLEGTLEEIKLQNEELAKKDQLAQFELEKNRSRLSSLEREYEDLKAKVQQNNQ